MSNPASKKNLTRFTYENSAFQGWRLSHCRKGKQFVSYFSDKKFGNAKKALEAAEAALADLKATLDSAKLVNGSHSDATVKKAAKIINPTPPAAEKKK